MYKKSKTEGTEFLPAPSPQPDIFIGKVKAENADINILTRQLSNLYSELR